MKETVHSRNGSPMKDGFHVDMEESPARAFHPSYTFSTPLRSNNRLANRENASPTGSVVSVNSPIPGSAGSRPSSTTPGDSGRRSHRGRPRTEMITVLMQQGSASPSPIKCPFCARVFPREKSLQAHKRTHTGDRPYVCRFSGCDKKFVQSGQLRTHERLHTGERPFICAATNCGRSYAHANRRCPVHPSMNLIRRMTTTPRLTEYSPPLDDIENYTHVLDSPADSTSDCATHLAKSSEWHQLSRLKERRRFSGTSRALQLVSQTPERPHTFDMPVNLIYYGDGPITPDTTSSMTESLVDDEQEDEQENNANLTNKRYLQANTPEKLLPKKRWMRDSYQSRTADHVNEALAVPIKWESDLGSPITHNKLLVVRDTMQKSECDSKDEALAVPISWETDEQVTDLPELNFSNGPNLCNKVLHVAPSDCEPKAELIELRPEASAKIVTQANGESSNGEQLRNDRINQPSTSNGTGQVGGQPADVPFWAVRALLSLQSDHRYNDENNNA